MKALKYRDVRRYRVGIILLIPLILFFIACGTDIDSPTGEIIAPPGSEIVINPSSLEVTDGSPTETRHYTTFAISVFDPEGKPIGRVKLKISYLWANPDDYNLVQLYDGSCSNSNPPTNPPKNSPMDAVTNDYGVYNLCVGFSTGNGLEYNASINVYSGTVYSSAELSIKSGT